MTSLQVPTTVDELRALIAQLARDEKALRAVKDFRSIGYRLVLRYGETIEVLEAIPPDHSTLGSFVRKTLTVLRTNFEALKKGDSYNVICERCLEKSELDLYFWREQARSTDEKVRLDAVSAAIALQWKALLPQLIEMVRGEAHPFVLSKLTKAIGSLGDESVLPVLEAFLGHEDERVRANTVEGLDAIDSAKKYPLIFRCINDSSNRVRANAAQALRKHGSSHFTSLLRRMAGESDEACRLSLLFVLSKMRSPLARDCLLDLLKNSGSDVTTQALDLLGDYPETSVVKAVAKVLGKGASARVATAGANALDRIRASGDTEAARVASALLQRIASRAKPSGAETATPLERHLAQTAGASAPPAASPRMRAIIARLMARFAAKGPRGLEMAQRREIEDGIRKGEIKTDAELDRRIAELKKLNWGV